MPKPIIRDYDRRTHKKCIKCRAWKPREDILAGDGSGTVETKHGFGSHKDSSDGLQSICYACKNVMNNKARTKNVSARLRHHTATRCLTQLGQPLTPKNFVANLEDYLGYRIAKLVKHLSHDLRLREGKKRKLRDALNEGYHIDHIKPLSSYRVVWTDRGGTEQVDWDEFRRCWAVENLTAIPALENLQKGAKYTPEPKNGDDCRECALKTEVVEQVQEDVTNSD
jgi:hypothetical protein